MDEGFDINAEYEKLHGPVARKMLFDDEEEYELLQKRIIAEPQSAKYQSLQQSLSRGQYLRRKYNVQPLPFEGVNLISYREWRLLPKIEEATNAGRHLYYLKKEVDNCLIVYAVGYYDKKQDGSFVVLECSFSIEDNNNTNHLRNYNFYREKGFAYEKHRHRYESATVAAKCYLGKSASLDDWKDENGISLADDKSYKEPAIETPSNTGVVQRKIEFSAVKNNEDGIVSEIINTKEKKSRHIFHLIFGVCDASGYFNQEDGVFYVCVGSIVSDGNFVSPKRQRFLDKACVKLETGWRVIKEAKCINASAAARYVTGEEVDYTLWRDDNGKYLKDYYPNYFFIGGESEQRKTQSEKETTTFKQPPIRWGAHAFFLRTEIGKTDAYDAKGYYDPSSGQFTLKDGSLLSLTTKAVKFDQSPVGRFRANIINENCTRERNGYRLLADVVCKDPIYAASVVIGKTINGWNMWKDSKGFYLSVYTQ